MEHDPDRLRSGVAPNVRVIQHVVLATTGALRFAQHHDGDASGENTLAAAPAAEHTLGCNLEGEGIHGESPDCDACLGSEVVAFSLSLRSDHHRQNEIIMTISDIIIHCTCPGRSSISCSVWLFRAGVVNPNDIVFGGWDISSMNLADAMGRAKVLDFDLQKQLRIHMESMVPLPGIFNPDFIAANQGSRANNILKGNKKEQVDHIIKDIREFKEKNKVDKVVVLWTANTERYSDVVVGLNDTMDNLLASLDKNEAEISPSTMYALACVTEGVPFVNGSPQNTFVPGLIELAIKKNSLIGGDDFKSGQTKMKSVLVDFLVGAGIKPTSIASYNHLGNNDGMNLSAPQVFRSKEISKSGVVDDMVASNNILYNPGEHPDHVIVIKYVPYVGDSKRAMDEYTSEIFMGGKNTIVLHNTCEDSLLAAPIILDLVLLAELSTRIQLKAQSQEKYHSFHPVATILSYLSKAPLVPPGTPVVNALAKQRAMLENILRACVGLAPENNMMLEHK
ncbi:hypothetical protein ACQ4PT_042453 [Festuca glaucescens]